MPTPGVTITGTIFDLSGTANPGTVKFTLVNFGDNIPLIGGSYLLAPIEIVCQAAGNGTFSQALWGTYQISPSNTFYVVTVNSADGKQIMAAAYQFNTAGSFDLSTLIPIVTSPGSPVASLVLPQSTGTTAHQWVNSYNAVTGAFTLSQPAFSDISGILAASQLPNPSASTLGGVESYAAVAHQFLTSISTSGVPASAQPAFTDISGIASTAQIPNLDASKITTGALPLARGGTAADLSATGGASQVLKQVSIGAAITVGQLAFTDISGTVAASQLPNPTATTLGGVESLAAVASKWINAISTSGVPTATQPAFSDISGIVAASQLPNPSALTLGGVQSLAATASKWIDSISTSGVPHASQPAFSDISGTASTAQIPALAASKITSGQLALAQGGTAADLSATGGASQVLKQVTLGGAVTVAQLAFSDLSGSVAASQLPNPSATTLGGIESIAAVTHKWIDSISTLGVPHLSQPAAADLSDGTTGSGLVVLGTSPTLTTPNIGAAIATSITGLTGALTPNAAGGTDIGSAAKPFANLYIGGSATNNIKITGTALAPRTLTLPDADSVTVQPFGGTAHQFVTSIQSTGQVISDRPFASDLGDGVTGSGAVVLAASPTLTTPVIGAATATSINKVAITAPATAATLTIADGKTLNASNSLTLAGTDGTTLTFQATGTVVNRDSTDTLTHKTIDTSGTGNHIQIAGVDLPVSIGTSGQVLTNNAGALAFTTVAGGGGGTPGGTTNQIQYNTGTAFGGVSVLTPAGTLVTGAAFKTSIKTFSATGNSDVYTCPANKRAIITEITVFNGQASTSSPMIAMLKIGGVYYPGTASLTISAQTAGSRSVTYILEAGETIAVNMTVQPFNVVATIMEFDNTSNLKSAKVTTPTLTSGDNTIYTVPGGKSALVLNNTLTMCSGTVGTLTHGNNSGGTVTVHFNVVASGGSVGSTNQMSAPVGTSTGAANQQSLTSFTLGAGDFISVNLSGGASDQIAFVTVVEI